MKQDLILLAKEAAKKLPKTSSGDPSAGLLSLVNAWQSYQQVCQQEKTRRAEIRARAEVEIERIRAQADALRQFITETFAERRENFNRFFAQLEEGLHTGNDRQIEVALTLIVTQIKESPIRQAAEVMRQIRERKPGEIIDL